MHIEKLDRVLRYVQGETNKELQLHQLRIFLLVVKSAPDPVSYPRIMREMNLSTASVSRNMRLLGVWMKKDKQGVWEDHGSGLVRVRPDPYEPRRHVGSLTKKGAVIAADISTLLAE